MAASAPSLKRRVFLFLLATVTVAVVLVTFVVSVIYQRSVEEDAQQKLSQECDTVASLVEESSDAIEVLEGLRMGSVRVTLIAADGTVRYDNLEAASLMENHAERPEVADALATGEGSSERPSSTVGTTSFYHAVRLSSGDVVRLAEDRAGVTALLARNVPSLVLMALVVVGTCWGVANVLSHRLVSPILDIDPASADDAPYQELEPLVERLVEQRGALVEQMERTKDAELMRQAFTSNVTHELKTPLASIQGAAELMRDGFVGADDVPAFAGRIYDSSQQLTSLVNDILTLSRLDESERAGDEAGLGTDEPCDLYALARDVADRVAPIAAAAGIEFSVAGSSTVVQGRPRLLDQLVTNLCNNAVRYNQPGGRVDVTVGEGDGQPFLRVADTGIGIAHEEQAKVFERFYRVDVSRSRERGGTGLGLAIVKHVATLHGATIDLASEPGKGTTVTVRFPA